MIVHNNIKLRDFIFPCQINDIEYDLRVTAEDQQNAIILIERGYGSLEVGKVFYDKFFNEDLKENTTKEEHEIICNNLGMLLVTEWMLQ